MTSFLDRLPVLSVSMELKIATNAVLLVAVVCIGLDWYGWPLLWGGHVDYGEICGE